MADEKIGAAPSTGRGRAVRGASLLILLQIVSRAITFIANQALLRFMTAQLLGISTQLEVYYLSVLFFARESLRVAIQRQGGEGEGKGKDARTRDSQTVVNLSYLSILLGIFVSLLLGWMYLVSANADVMTTPYLPQSLYIYATAAILELLSEPVFVVIQIRLQFGTRATAESVATFVRCVVTLGSAVWAARRGLELGVLPFALGQLSYGMGLLFVYGWCGLSLAKNEGFSLLPKQLVGNYVLSYLYRPTLNLASSMIAQSLVKQILTQGDTFLVSILSTPTAQGVYALANNYGGLAARLIFQPIEESSRNYFSRLLLLSSDKDARAKASNDLHILLKFYISLSLIVTALGPAAATPLLSLITGPRWASSGAGETLAVYMWYIPLLAINGVVEAFVASVASEAEVHRQSAWMGVFSLVFAGVGFMCLQILDMGAVGLVLANCVNMACRIIWCAVFIKRYFGAPGIGMGGSFDIGELRPSPLGLLAAVVTSQVVKRIVSTDAAGGPKAQLLDLGKIAVMAVPFIAVLAFSERNFLRKCYSAIRSQQQAKARG